MKNSEFKDFVGNKLHAGDKIVYVRTFRHGKEMRRTEVIGFTEKMVKIPNHRTYIDAEYECVSPHNCIVYKQPDEEVTKCPS